MKIAALMSAILLAGTGSPQADDATTNKNFKQIDASVVLEVVYTCRNDDGSGCSAGCASASFSPLMELTVTLYSLKRPYDGKNIDILHYLAKFPETVERNAKRAGAKRPKAITKAEGFTLDATSLCGTVNMIVTKVAPTKSNQ
jgi:hypothetical protein